MSSMFTVAAKYHDISHYLFFFSFQVESPIFCDLLDQADSDGLLDHIKLQ